MDLEQIVQEVLIPKQWIPILWGSVHQMRYQKSISTQCHWLSVQKEVWVKTNGKLFQLPCLTIPSSVSQLECGQGIRLIMVCCDIICRVISLVLSRLYPIAKASVPSWCVRSHGSVCLIDVLKRDLWHKVQRHRETRAEGCNSQHSLLKQLYHKAVAAAGYESGNNFYIILVCGEIKYLW